MKYKVIIVDDEEAIRKGLKILIDWDAYDFEILAVLSDGEAALEFIKQTPVDVALVDINMPHLTGLELLRSVREFNTHIQFIIISGYNDFQYAQEAINYDVLTYLLKPIEEEELESALIRAKKIFAAKETSNLTDYLNRSLSIDRHFDMESAKITPPDEKPDAIYYITIVEDGILDTSGGTIALSFHQNIHEKMLRCSAEILGEDFTNFIFKTAKNETSLVLAVGASFPHASLKAFLDQLKRLFLKWNITGYYVLVGKAANELQEISKSRETVGELKNKIIYAELGSILDYNSDACARPSGVSHINTGSQVTEKIYIAIRQANPELLSDGVNELCEVLYDEKIEYKAVQLYVHSIVMYSIDFIKTDHKARCVLNMLADFDSVGYIRLSEFKALLLYFFHEIITVIREEKEKESLHIISDILDYIDLNYSEAINLQTIAKKFYINSAYLGRLFKSKIGMSFNSYLNKVRIDHAKELLKKTNLKLSDIAEKIGYNNFNYFIKKFEESEKMTPKSYRENHML